MGLCNIRGTPILENCTHLLTGTLCPEIYSGYCSDWIRLTLPVFYIFCLTHSQPLIIYSGNDRWMKYKYWILIWIRHGETEVPRAINMSRCHSVHHCMQHELSWNHTWTYSDRLATNNLSHGMTPPMSYMIKTALNTLFVISDIIQHLPTCVVHNIFHNLQFNL